MMKKYLVMLLLVVSVFANLSALEFKLEFAAMPSPVYAGAWSPALQGAGLGFSAQEQLGPGQMHLGLEGAVDGLGIQVLLPVGYGYTFVDDKTWRISTGINMLPGLAMFRPLPFFMIGAEARISGAWFWNSNWGLELSTGVRWLSCPTYSSQVHNWDSWEIPVTLGLVYRIP